MRDNQPKISEAAAAPLRSRSRRGRAGPRLEQPLQRQDGHQHPRPDSQISIAPCLRSPCCVAAENRANLGPPAAWRRAVAEIFIFHFSLLARRQQTGDTAASRGDEDKLKYNFPAASGQWPRRTPGWRRGHRQGPDHRSLRVNTQRGLQSSPPPPPRRGHCVPSLSPAACCGQDRVLVVRPGATSVWLDS